MATSTFYQISSPDFSSPILDNITAGDQSLPTVTTLADGGWFAAWASLNGLNSKIDGNVEEQSGASRTQLTAPLTTTTNGAQTDPQIAGLSNGNAILVFTDNSNGSNVIRGRLLNAQGIGIAPDFQISSPTASPPQTHAHVAALIDGGFAVTWQYEFSTTDFDIATAVYNSDGSVRTAVTRTNASSSNDTEVHVAGLALGGYVEVWTHQVPLGASTGTEIHAQRFRGALGLANGSEITVTTASFSEQLDDEPAVIGLMDGGFAIAYQSQAFAGVDITLAIYNSDGSLRNRVLANTAATSGFQAHPALTELSNGFIDVAWNTENNSASLDSASDAVFDASGNLLVDGGLFSLGHSDQVAVTGLANGGFAFVTRDTFAAADGSGTAIQGEVDHVVRNFIGDDLPNTFAGDSLVDLVNGGAGDDILSGNGGDDLMDGGTGSNTMDGGTGNDAAFFAFRRTDAVISHDSAGRIIIEGPATRDVLTGFEHYHFTDVTVSFAPPEDFNADRTSDILWHAGNGDTAVATITGNQQTNWQDGGIIPPFLQVAATADFNGDGATDLLWHSGSSGDTTIATYQAGAQSGWSDLGNYPAGFNVAGAGDFDADGSADILWRRSDNGDTTISTIQNGHQTQWTDLGAYSTSFDDVRVGDFNGDGTADILFHSSSSGDLTIADIQNDQQVQSTDLGNYPTFLHLAGVGDFNGDGTTDVLWRAVNGDTAISTMQNNHQVQWTDLGIYPTLFDVAAVGDYNRDGTSDILFHAASSGDTAIASFQNNQQVQWTDMGNVPTFLTPVGV